ncbi:hypothetical protein CF326_g3853 [Tilletia indica]|nr:hypothetical protein CF326_g3853 [Tilletia indica]
MRFTSALTFLAIVSTAALVGATPVPAKQITPEQGFGGGFCRPGPGCGYGKKRAEALAAAEAVLIRGKIRPEQGFGGGFCRGGPGCGYAK